MWEPGRDNKRDEVIDEMTVHFFIHFLLLLCEAVTFFVLYWQGGIQAGSRHSRAISSGMKTVRLT